MLIVMHNRFPWDEKPTSKALYKQYSRPLTQCDVDYRYVSDELTLLAMLDME